MLGNLANLYSYTRTPKATYYLKHPRKAIAARRTMTRMKGDTAQRIALGIGAAAIAVPLGMWASQKMRRM